MELEIAKLIVPSIISILGFIITIVVMLWQFKNATKQKVTDSQRRIYLDTYIDIERVIGLNELVFDTSYYDAIISHKGEMKLFASNDVIHEYEKFLKYVQEIMLSTCKWISENDPEKKEENYELMFDDVSGKEVEICHVTDDMVEQFEYDYCKYKEEHMPDSKEVKHHVESLLNKMRIDLGGDMYEF